jgi:hypothetical protein
MEWKLLAADLAQIHSLRNQWACENCVPFSIYLPVRHYVGNSTVESQKRIMAIYLISLSFFGKVPSLSSQNKTIQSGPHDYECVLQYPAGSNMGTNEHLAMVKLIFKLASQFQTSEVC